MAVLAQHSTETEARTKARMLCGTLGKTTFVVRSRATPGAWEVHDAPPSEASPVSRYPLVAEFGRPGS